MNKTTKAEREALIARAAQLLLAGWDQRGAERALQDRGISKQRARTAVAKAIMRQRKPRK
jgi:hypothetical protein